MAFNFPRPTYPIAGEFFLGSLMFAWGLWVLVFPGSPHSGGYSLRWFWNLGEERAVAAAATGLGIFKILCAYMVWSKGGKIAATLATGFWLQLGVEGYTAAPHVHPPVCALYFGAALCSLFIIWAEERG